MADKELLLAISDIIDKKLEPVTTAMETLQHNLGNLQNNVEVFQQDMGDMRNDMDVVKQKITSIEIKLENETNHNIQLLAENHINLADKLNQAIRVSDKTLLYEVQVSSLKSKVEYLEKEVAEIKATV